MQIINLLNDESTVTYCYYFTFKQNTPESNFQLSKFAAEVLYTLADTFELQT